MVKLFAIAFLAFLGLAAARNSPCPAEDGAYALTIPNPNDCGSFFICNHGEPVLFSCPAGLEFNSRLGVCDWPASAGCRSRPTTTTTTTTTTTRRPTWTTTRRPTSTTTRRPRPTRRSLNPSSDDDESIESEETK